MATLNATHPHAHQALTNGEFAVQRSSQPFVRVPVDQSIEQTVNRDSKTSGGIIGFSTKLAAMQRWIQTAHERAGLTTACRQLAGVADDGSSEVPHKK